jgi:hypothetical protein
MLRRHFLPNPDLHDEVYEPRHRVTHVTRAQIEADQIAWEERKAKTVHLEMDPDDPGRLWLHGVDMRDFHDTVGPRRSADFLQGIGELRIIEPSPLKRVGEAIGKVGAAAQLLIERIHRN